MKNQNRQNPNLSKIENSKAFKKMEQEFDKQHDEFVKSMGKPPKLTEEDGKFGLKTSEGEILLPPEFEEIYLLSGQEMKPGDRIVVCKDGKRGVAIADGKVTWLLEPEYDYIGYPNNLTHVCKDGKWGVIDLTEKKFLIPTECDSISQDQGFMFTNGISVFERDGKFGVITETRNFTDAIFDEVDGFPDDWVKVKFECKWGYINENNQFTPDEDKASFHFIQ